MPNNNWVYFQALHREADSFEMINFIIIFNNHSLLSVYLQFFSILVNLIELFLIKRMVNQYSPKQQCMN